MDSAERREFLKRLAGAVDVGFRDDLAFFLGQEVVQSVEASFQEPQSALFGFVGLAEDLGLDVADAYYEDDGKGPVVLELRNGPIELRWNGP